MNHKFKTHSPLTTVQKRKITFLFTLCVIACFNAIYVQDVKENALINEMKKDISEPTVIQNFIKLSNDLNRIDQYPCLGP
ncbi:hypothetical protein [Winogradskyella arenosi]|uniref:Uncharacterized protein n=1 Tax=Winogradskyella arenosi TaxID=533325 RepID=A0A368ZH67_9FLAO|nr:hypothetical protein [Winogradskyella arenosi]RCW92832.1 hypothetical protein DFQ08_102868 [Winogradskyella arenosi]